MFNVNSLFNITRPDEQELKVAQTHLQTLSDTLAVIGNEALGAKNAKENPNIAIDIGLAPVLNDRLSLMDVATNLWASAIPNIGTDKQLTDVAKFHLNSFYHVESVEPKYPKNCKGTFVELSGAVLSVEEEKQKLEGKLGRSLDELFVDEFISTRVLKDKTKPECKRLREEAKSHITLGFVELSADCDQAQRKTKLNKYLISALIPIQYQELTVFENKDGVQRDRSHDGIYKCPTFELNGQFYTLFISFRYQIGTNHKNNKWLGDSKFRLKEQIMADIGFRCAQHAVRPEVTAFL